MGGFCDVLEYVLLRRRMLPMKPRFLGELGESSLAGLSGRSGPALRRLPLDSALPSLTCGAALPLVPFVMPRLRRAASIAFSMSEESGTTGRDCLLRPREALRGSSSSSSDRSVESPSLVPSPGNATHRGQICRDHSSRAGLVVIGICEAATEERGLLASSAVVIIGVVRIGELGLELGSHVAGRGCLTRRRRRLALGFSSLGSHRIRTT